MNPQNQRRLRFGLCLAAGLALAVMAGCGERAPETRPAATVAADVQGELITAPVPAPAPDRASEAFVAEVPAPASAAPAATPPKGTPAQPLTVAFDQLAGFAYTVPDGPVETNQLSGAASQIPADIQSLDRQFVSLKGFMLPLKVEKGLVTELLLMRDQSMCCYGVVPKINEWVSVKMTGGGVKPVMDTAVTLHGTLKVGEIFESGYLVGIYEMSGERMSDALDM